jgi:hypothetical protein
MPVSVNVTAASLPCTDAVNVMRPPRSVYLTALLSRLANACASRGQVGVDPERIVRQIHRHDVAGGLAERLDGFDGAADRVAQVEPLAAQLDPVAGDA